MTDKELKKLTALIRDCGFVKSGPIDRYALEPYINELYSLSLNDQYELILHNLEYSDDIYGVRLMTCIYEFWEELSYQNMLNFVKRFSSPFGAIRFIEFGYRYLEIDLLEAFIKLSCLNIQQKTVILNQFRGGNQILLGDEIEKLYYTKGYVGVSIKRLKDAGQKFIDNQLIILAQNDISYIENRIEELITKYSI